MIFIADRGIFSNQNRLILLRRHNKSYNIKNSFKPEWVRLILSESYLRILSFAAYLPYAGPSAHIKQWLGADMKSSAKA
jgi:hypothetical protein